MTDAHSSSISTNQFVDQNFVDKTQNDFKKSGISLKHFKGKSAEAYNFVEIIIPTAVVVFFVGPFVKEISKNLAKDSYNAVKKLFRRTLGENRDVRYEMRRTDGELIPPTFSRELSFSFKFNEKFSIIFLIKSDADEKDALISFTKAMAFVSELAANKTKLDAAQGFLSQTMGFFGQAYLIHHDGEMLFLDWPSSSQLEEIQVFSLPSF